MSAKPLTKKEWGAYLAKTWSDAVEATYQDMIDKAVLKEREACAKICDKQAKDKSESDHWIGCAQYLANNIRARTKA